MGALIDWPDDAVWIPVEDESAPGYVRRAAGARARSLGFTEERAGEIAIAASELSTNLFRHAVRGMMLLRVRRGATASALELFSIDSGPGFEDLSIIMRDGESTGGTLGIGLGAVRRFSTSFDAHSVPGRGTIIVATFGVSDQVPDVRTAGGLARPMNGETVCGDAWAQRSADGKVTVMLADGLGHGELAAIAGREAVRAFVAEGGDHSLTAIMRRLNDALRSTRGAAVGLLHIDRAAKSGRFVGIGNIAAWIDDGIRRNGLVSTPGIVGSFTKRVRELEFAVPDGAIAVMHSDGLTSKWNLSAYPGLRSRDPRLVAATLLRDAGIHHDDASVVVA